MPFIYCSWKLISTNFFFPLALSPVKQVQCLSGYEFRGVKWFREETQSQSECINLTFNSYVYMCVCVCVYRDIYVTVVIWIRYYILRDLEDWDIKCNILDLVSSLVHWVFKKRWYFVCCLFWFKSYLKSHIFCSSPRPVWSSESLYLKRWFYYPTLVWLINTSRKWKIL